MGALAFGEGKESKGLLCERFSKNFDIFELLPNILSIVVVFHLHQFYQIVSIDNQPTNFFCTTYSWFAMT